jgi:hypothetical protein
MSCFWVLSVQILLDALKMISFKKVAVFFLNIAILGCTTVEDQIAKCVEHSRIETGASIPEGDLQKAMQGKMKDKIFYKCMVDGGYKPNPEFISVAEMRYDRTKLDFPDFAYSKEKSVGLNQQKCMYSPNTCGDFPPFWIKK